MRALVLAGLLLCSLASHAQGPSAFQDSIDQWREEAGDPSIKTSFGLAAVAVRGTAVPGPPGQEGPFGLQGKDDGLIGLGTIDLAIDAPFDARGNVTVYGSKTGPTSHVTDPTGSVREIAFADTKLPESFTAAAKTV